MPWPTINELAVFTRQQVDETMDWALDAAISYGQTVLASSNLVPNEPDASVFNGCLDYAASLYTARIGGVDLTIEPGEGSTPLQRYRKLLLVSRPVGFA